LFLLPEPRLAEISDGPARCLRSCESVSGDLAGERIVLIGGQAEHRPFRQAIARRLGLPGQVGYPTQGIRRRGRAGRSLGLDVPGAHPPRAAPIGLSLGATVAG
jgi:hypothetical protein